MYFFFNICNIYIILLIERNSIILSSIIKLLHKRISGNENLQIRTEQV